MGSFKAFIELLLPVREQANSCGDKILNLILSGENFSSDISSCIGSLLNWAYNNNAQDAFAFSVDDEVLDQSEISNYQFGTLPESWQLVVNKGALQSVFCDEKNEGVIFFLSKSDFENWVKQIDPLINPQSPVSESRTLRIYSPTVETPFGGPFLAVLPLEYDGDIEFKPSQYALPNSEQITQQVHLVPAQPMRVTPQALSLSWGDLSQPAAAVFRLASATNLAACVVDVLYGHSKAVIKGMRHIETPLIDKSVVDVSVESLACFERAVSWLYEERTDTRSRLLGDRISLDAEKKRCIVANLVSHLPESLEQAVDQYRFVVLDRKDEYAKERRDLLKDIRSHSEIYAEKTRSLIASFSRDTLAALVFASFSLGRIFDNDTQSITGTGALFFKVLSVYFGISILLQVGATLRDIHASNGELRKWAKVSREYLTKAEIDDHIDKDLEPRKVTFRFFLGLVVLIYITLALLSWNLEYVLNLYNTISMNGQQEAL